MREIGKTRAWYVILLDCHEPGTSQQQAEQLLEGLKSRLETRFVKVPLQITVRHVAPEVDFDAPLQPQIEELVDAFGLSEAQWERSPVIPRLPDDPRIAGPLLAEINRRRGYDWPIVRPKPQTPEERQRWDRVETGDDVVQLLAELAGYEPVETLFQAPIDVDLVGV
jgi:hypothetical protein